MAGASGWRFATVSLTFWNDLKVRGWSDDGRMLALYMLTNPHRSGEGYYHLPLRLAADDLGWPDERLTAAMAELQATGFVDVDKAARLVFIVRALKYQPTIKGTPSLRGAINALERAKGSPRLFARFLAAADDYQPDLAHAIREHYDLPPGPYEGASDGATWGIG
jgi:hypothetical protein